MVEARTRAMVGLAPKTDVARRRQRMPCYLPPPAVTRALELSQRQACAGRAGGRWADEALRPRQRPARPGTGPSFGHGPFCERMLADQKIGLLCFAFRLRAFRCGLQKKFKFSNMKNGFNQVQIIKMICWVFKNRVNDLYHGNFLNDGLVAHQKTMVTKLCD